MKSASILFLLLLSTVFAHGQERSSLLQAVKSADTDSMAIQAYRELAGFYRYSNRDSAIFYAHQGLTFARQHGYRLGEGIMVNALAQINERHGLLELAEQQYLEAKTIFMTKGYVKGIAATTNGLGVVSGKTGQYEKATRYFLEALHLFEKTRDKNGIVQCYIKLGVVNDHLGNLDQALTYYLKAEELNRSLPASSTGPVLLNNIGIIHGRRNDLRTALRYFHRGLGESDPAASTGVHIALLGSLGTAYEKAGKRDSALHFQEQALALARKNSLPEEEARALVNLSPLYRRSDPAKSLRLLTDALEITERIQHLILMSEIYDAMIEFYRDGNDYKQAFHLAEKRRLMKDSLFSLQKSKEIANLQAVHQVARQDDEIRNLAIINEKSILQRDIMIGVALIAVLVIGIVWFFNTKVSNLNAQLLHQQNELRNSNTIKDKLFSILGHDLRAPLNGVIGYLDVLALSRKNKEENDVINKLKEQSVQTLETLDNLLMWGQRELKGIRVNQQTVNASERIGKSLFFVADHADRKNVELVNDTPSDLEVWADPTHFDFVMRNLLSNAIKFSHRGGRVCVNAVPSSGDQVIFSIQDAGVGIAPDVHEKIFTAAHGSTRGTWDEKGTGLGLMLCREYITHNGGRMWVDSEPGKGSTFYFFLPHGRIAREGHPEQATTGDPGDIRFRVR